MKPRHAGYFLSVLALCAIAALAWFFVRGREQPPLPDRKLEPHSIKESRPAAVVASTESDVGPEDLGAEMAFPHLPSPEEAGQAQTEFWEKLQKASEEWRYLDAIALCDEFLRKYPPTAWPTLGAVAMRAHMLEEAGQVEEARRAFEQALVAYRNTADESIVELWMANFDRRHKDFAAAEGRLSALLAVPMPDEIRSMRDEPIQLRAVPKELAEVYKDQLRYDDTEAVLRQARDRAVQVALKNPGVPGLSSCVLDLYTEMAWLRVETGKEADFEEDTKRTREAVEEYLSLFPESDEEARRDDLRNERALLTFISLRKRARGAAAGQVNAENNEESLPYITSR